MVIRSSGSGHSNNHHNNKGTTIMMKSVLTPPGRLLRLLIPLDDRYYSIYRYRRYPTIGGDDG